MKDRIKKHIDNWNTWFLSQRDKKVFIKVILHAIPTYSMACFLLPKSFYDKLESLVAHFGGKRLRVEEVSIGVSRVSIALLKTKGE